VSDGHGAGRGRTSRGSALLLAVLAAVVLAVIGLALALYTQSESTISGNDQRQKESFYAAEVGLRQGESLLANGALNTPATVSALLTAVPPAPAAGEAPSTLTPPGGGFTANLLVLNNTAWRDVPVPMPAGSRERATFSLYVRNDAEDKQGNATTDSNRVLNLIAVGVVKRADAGGVLVLGTTTITRILEEQVQAQLSGSEGGLMKGSNAGGTGSLSN
jgi:hypothetical protein